MQNTQSSLISDAVLLPKSFSPIILHRSANIDLHHLVNIVGNPAMEFAPANVPGQPNSLDMKRARADHMGPESRYVPHGHRESLSKNRYRCSKGSKCPQQRKAPKDGLVLMAVDISPHLTEIIRSLEEGRKTYEDRSLCAKKKKNHAVALVASTRQESPNNTSRTHQVALHMHEHARLI